MAAGSLQTFNPAGTSKGQEIERFQGNSENRLRVAFGFSGRILDRQEAVK
jgi:hypothetical protein